MDRLWSDTARTIATAIVVASLLVPGTAYAIHKDGEHDAALPSACDGSFYHGVEDSTSQDVGPAVDALKAAVEKLKQENVPTDSTIDLLDLSEKHVVNAAECLDQLKTYCSNWVALARSQLPPAVPQEVQDAAQTHANEDLQQTVDDVYPSGQEGTAAGAANQACSALSSAASSVDASSKAQMAIGEARDALQGGPDDPDEALQKAKTALSELESVRDDLEEEVLPVLSDIKDATHTVLKAIPGRADRGDMQDDSGDHPEATRDIHAAWLTDARVEDRDWLDVHVLIELNATHHEVEGQRQHAEQEMSFDFDGTSAHYRVFAQYKLADEAWSATLQKWDGGDDEWNDMTSVQISEEGTVIALTLPGGTLDLQAGDRIMNPQVFTYEEDSSTLSTMSTEDQLGSLTVADVAPGPIGADYDPSDPSYGADYEVGSSFDDDADGVPDHRDNCPQTANPDQDPAACEPADDPSEEDPEDTNPDKTGDDKTEDDGTDSTSSEDDAAQQGFPAVAGVSILWILLIAMIVAAAIVVGAIIGRD